MKRVSKLFGNNDDIWGNQKREIDKAAIPKEKSYASVRARTMSMVSMNVGNNAVAYQLYGSHNRIEEEQEKMNKAPMFTIHPYSNFRIIWDLLTMVMLFANIVLVPLSIAFFSNTKKNEKMFMSLFLLSDLWFLFDILLNLRTGVTVQRHLDNEVIFEPNEIRKTYIKGWFFIDLISSIPWDVLISSFMDADQTSFQGVRMLKILKLIKLLRITRLAKAVQQWEEVLDFQYNISISETTVKIIRLGCLIFFVVHINACILFMVPSFMGFPTKDDQWGPSWPVLRNLTHSEPSVQYFWSVFMASSHMLVIGFGGQSPVSIVDMWVTIYSMVSGAATFACIISEITSLIRSMEHSAVDYTEKITRVKEYMNFCRLPGELRAQIREYYAVKYQGKMFDEKKILAELNPILREKVINYNCRAQLKTIDFLANIDSNVLSDLMGYLKFDIYLQGDEIIKEGSFDSDVYFINTGTVLVKSKLSSSSEGRLLSEGEHFGEFCLLMPYLKRTASVIAKTNVCLYSITSDDFEKVLQWYPSERLQMHQITIERLREVLQRLTNEEVWIEPDIIEEIQQKYNHLIKLNDRRKKNEIEPQAK